MTSAYKDRQTDAKVDKRFPRFTSIEKKVKFSLSTIKYNFDNMIKMIF